MLTGSVAIDAAGRGIGADGTLTSPALEGGPLRVHGSARYHEDRLDLVSLRAWLPRSGATLAERGTVEFGGESPRLALEGEWSSLRCEASENGFVFSVARASSCT